jgi:Mn-dependent DtxR family transcriptional regulator
MQIPPAIRGKLAQADLITYQRRGRYSVLTQRGKEMLREIKEEKTP